MELRARNISPNDSPFYVYNTKKSERCGLKYAQIFMMYMRVVSKFGDDTLFICNFLSAVGLLDTDGLEIAKESQQQLVTIIALII